MPTHDERERRSGPSMRIRGRVIVFSVASVCVAAAGVAAQDPLTSPYQHQRESGLRGLNEREIAELRAGAGMGLARAAELNSYPGPRHVLDAIDAGRLQANPDQVRRLREIFDGMQANA